MHMENSEIKNELCMTYAELVDYLLEKYGKVSGDYFCSESCRTRNRKISRASDGLFCHHIDEDKAINLSNHECAINEPFEYQKADRLVYCNILEHLILHIKIAFENESAGPFKPTGIGGILNICFAINEYFDGHESKNQKKLYEVLADNFNCYIGLLIYISAMAKKRPEYDQLLTEDCLCSGFDGRIVKRVYEALCK